MPGLLIFMKNGKAVQVTVGSALVLRDTTLWGHDLSSLPGFADAVQEKLNEIEESGMAAVIDPQHSKKSIA